MPTGPTSRRCGSSATLARRIESLPIALIVAARTTAGVTALLTVARRGPIDARFVDACREATGGNPFLLDALVRSLDEGAIPLGTPTARPHEVRRPAASRRTTDGIRLHQRRSTVGADRTHEHRERSTTSCTTWSRPDRTNSRRGRFLTEPARAPRGRAGTVQGRSPHCRSRADRRRGRSGRSRPRDSRALGSSPPLLKRVERHRLAHLGCGSDHERHVGLAGRHHLDRDLWHTSLKERRDRLRKKPALSADAWERGRLARRRFP